RWIDQACEQLSNFYGLEISKEEKLKGREELFRRLKEDLKRTVTSFKTESYSNLANVEMNNAVLLAYRRYIHRLEKFEALYRYFGQDLRKMIGFLREIQGSRKEASSYLERWMKERGINVPAFPQ
ncbi:MAG TPA: aminopeptidase, partial [Thermodesulfobacteriota bacterium]|nr:aminopeptidase [Thermodesulfobacteriota bacterium]